MNGILFSLHPNTSIMVFNTLVLLGECPIALEHGRNDTKIANLLITYVSVRRGHRKLFLPSLAPGLPLT